VFVEIDMLVTDVILERSEEI